MKTSKILLIFAALFLIAAQVYAAPANGERNTITVQGTGSLSIAPSEAVVQVGILSLADTAEQARQENANIAQRVQRALTEVGIAKESIQTSHYNLSPTYSNEKSKLNQIVGYNASNTVSVTIGNLDLVGNVIDASIKSGANNVYSVRFNAKNDAVLRQRALTAAVKDARQKADAIAAALGKQIIGVVSANENGVSVNNRVERYTYAAKSAMMDATTPIEPGTIDVNANIVVVYEIN